METGSLDGVKVRIAQLRTEIAFLHGDEVRGGDDHTEEKRKLLREIEELKESTE